MENAPKSFNTWPCGNVPFRALKEDRSVESFVSGSGRMLTNPDPRTRKRALVVRPSAVFTAHLPTCWSNAAPVTTVWKEQSFLIPRILST